MTAPARVSRSCTRLPCIYKELARSHSTTELLPLSTMILQHLASVCQWLRKLWSQLDFDLLGRAVELHNAETADLPGPGRLGLGRPARAGFPAVLQHRT